MPELSKRYINLWLDIAKAGAIEEIARGRGVDVSQVVEEILSPVLEGADSDEEHMGRFVLLRVPERTYRQYVRFFQGDIQLAKDSMLAHVECGGDDFGKSMNE